MWVYDWPGLAHTTSLGSVVRVKTANHLDLEKVLRKIGFVSPKGGMNAGQTKAARCPRYSTKTLYTLYSNSPVKALNFD